jgi:hypothetical protein
VRKSKFKRPGLIRASTIGPWHFGHCLLSSAINGIADVELGSVIACRHVAVAESGDDAISVALKVPQLLINIAHV